MKFTPLKRRKCMSSLGKKGKLAKTPDQEASRICREIGRCMMAGHEITCSGELQAHHIIHRAQSKKLRRDQRNLLCVCEGHHGWLHNNPNAFREWLDLENPGLYDRLKGISNEPNA